MESPLSADTLARIQETAAQITVANDLDPGIQAELRSHLEEKLLAYLSGQKKLSEADALLLTGAHFGNPATIKSLFQHAHPQAYQVSLARRLIAAFIGTIVVSYVFWNVMGVLSVLLLIPMFRPLLAPGSQTPMIVWILFLVEYPALTFINLFILWRLFAWWRRGIAQGRRYWFHKWPLYLLLLLVPLAWLAASYSIPLPQGPTFTTEPAFMTWLFPKVTMVTSTLSGALTILLWLRWCDRPPFTCRAAIYPATAWFILKATGTLVGFTNYVYFNGGRGFPSKQPPSVYQVVAMAQPLLLHIFLIASIVVVVYLLGRRRLNVLLPA